MVASLLLSTSAASVAIFEKVLVLWERSIEARKTEEDNVKLTFGMRCTRGRRVCDWQRQRYQPPRRLASHWEGCLTRGLMAASLKEEEKPPDEQVEIKFKARISAKNNVMRRRRWSPPRRTLRQTQIHLGLSLVVLRRTSYMFYIWPSVPASIPHRPTSSIAASPPSASTPFPSPIRPSKHCQGSLPPPQRKTSVLNL